MDCEYCPIQDLCLEYYNKVLVLHDFVDKNNCPLLEVISLDKENKYE